MKLLGKSYIFSAIIDRYNQEKIQHSFREYVTDCLYIIISDEKLPRWSGIVKAMMNGNEPKENGQVVKNRIKNLYNETVKNK